jgi:heme/copper-type cytochrome/quinol oxidase subunit 2
LFSNLLQLYASKKEDQLLNSKGLFIYAGVTTGSILFGVVVIAVYQIYSFRKSEEEYQAKVERFLDD